MQLVFTMVKIILAALIFTSCNVDSRSSFASKNNSESDADAAAPVITAPQEVGPADKAEVETTSDAILGDSVASAESSAQPSSSPTAGPTPATTPKPVQRFTHLPKPATCADCHVRPLTVGKRAYPTQGPPAGFNANDPAAIGGKHYVGKDCSSCHRTPAEGATVFSFTHSAPKAEFCLPCHFNRGQTEHANNNNNVMLQGFGNCFNCHKNFDVNTARNFGRN